MNMQAIEVVVRKQDGLNTNDLYTLSITYLVDNRRAIILKDTWNKSECGLFAAIQKLNGDALDFLTKDLAGIA